MGKGVPGAVPVLQMLGLGDADVYVCPAPFYHGAPLAYSIAAHRLGATVVVMERFDAVQPLRLIEQHQVTHSQWPRTPTSKVKKFALRQQLREEAATPQ